MERPGATPRYCDQVTIDEALARLVPLPDPLPPAPPELMPVPAGGEPWPPLGTGEPEARPAAVLVLLVPDEARAARVVLIERPAYEGHHSGEVSFPGGKAEPGDADLVATALREATEEIGLDAAEAGVEVLGMLDPVWVAVSGFRITPIVAVARRRPRLVPDAGEVVRIVEAPVRLFLPGAPIVIVERAVRGWPLRYGVYPVDGLEVWGATARILGQLGALLGRS